MDIDLDIVMKIDMDIDMDTDIAWFVVQHTGHRAGRHGQFKHKENVQVVFLACFFLYDGPLPS